MRTWNDTEWNWCIKETGGKFLGQWKVQISSGCRGSFAKNPDRVDIVKSSHKIIKLAKATETLIQSSYKSDSDGYNCRPEIQKIRRKHLKQQSTKHEHRSLLKGILHWITRIGKIRKVNSKRIKYEKGLDNFLPISIKKTTTTRKYPH